MAGPLDQFTIKPIIDLQVGDLFILSTDGFHDFVSPLATQEIVSEADSLSRTAIKLAQEALVEKSNDNISCLLVRVEQVPSKNQLELFDLVKNKKIPPALSVGMKLDGFLIKQVIHASSRSHLYLAEEGNLVYSVRIHPDLKIIWFLDLQKSEWPLVWACFGVNITLF